MPAIKSSIKSIGIELDRPIKLMLTAVIAGAKMTKYFIPVRSAIRPKKGFISEGTRRVISSKATIERDIPSLAVSNGRRGAKNDE